MSGYDPDDRRDDIRRDQIRDDIRRDEIRRDETRRDEIRREAIREEIRRQAIRDEIIRDDDRRYDQQREEQDRTKRSQALNDALRAKDWPKVRYLLGLPPENSPARREAQAVSETNGTPPTAEEQFAEHSGKLSAKLMYSTTLPGAVREAWIQQVKEIDLYEPTKGLVLLNDLSREVDLAKDLYRPRPSIWSLGIEPLMHFSDTMAMIESELEWLRDILQHVERFFREHPLAADSIRLRRLNRTFCEGAPYE
jgi:hypothetical protein